jgi:dCMP deaminase
MQSKLGEQLFKDLPLESDDPDTQVICYIGNAPSGDTSSGANSLPQQVKVTHTRTHRPEKYTWLQHAEAVAIAKAARYGQCLYGATAITNWFPCAACAGLLINAGIKKVVGDREVYEQRRSDPRYGFAEAMTMLQEAGVAIEWL